MMSLNLRSGLSLSTLERAKAMHMRTCRQATTRYTLHAPSQTSRVKHITRQMFTTSHTSKHLLQLVPEHDFSRLRVSQDAFEVAQASARIHVQVVTKNNAFTRSNCHENTQWEISGANSDGHSAGRSLDNRGCLHSCSRRCLALAVKD